MKRIIITFCLICSITLSLVADTSKLFYYGLGEKNELELIPNKFAIQKSSDVSKEIFLQNFSLASNKLINIEWRGENMCILEHKEISEISIIKKRLSQSKEDIVFLPLYHINKSAEGVLFPEIIVKTKSSTLDESLLSKYGLKLKSDKKRYQIYSVPKDSDVIDIANKIYETGECIFSYPHFQVPAQSMAYIPNDTYFQYQITCHNTGQTLPNGHTGSPDADIDAPDAWDITKGSSDIIIAVFDEGVTSNHPDLPNSKQVRLNGSNFGSGDPNDPSPTGNSNHGNACAGVIAASMNNNEGIAGIAPNCKIMPLRWDNSSSDAAMADGIYFAMDNGANIISCSWAYNSANYSSPVIISAISTAIENNVVVVFSAGNTANHVNNNGGYVSFPANANIPYLITVGASDRYDHVANYSPISPLIDVVAPSHKAYPSQISGETLEMWSLDIPGFAGYNPIPSEMSDYAPEGSILPDSGTNRLAYTGYFGGTSHSCPVVAGVVALMLSVNPFLTPEDVYDILTETSDKVGGYTYNNGRCNQMGYGRVNAYSAVVEAGNRHPIQETDYVCDTTCFYLVDAPNNATFTWEVQCPMAIQGDYHIIDGQGTPNVCVKHITIFPIFAKSSEDKTLSFFDEDLQIPSLNISGYIRVTVTTSDSTYVISRKLRAPKGSTPKINASDTTHSWPRGQMRSFTLANCVNEPDSAFLWIAQRGDFILSSHRGRTFNYSPIFPGLFTISVTNTRKECGVRTANLSYYVPYEFGLIATVNQGILDIVISTEESEEEQSGKLLLNKNNNYTLELLHSIYGLMKEQTVHSIKEQMDIRNLPHGTYVLVLKENGNILSEVKITL